MVLAVVLGLVVARLGVRRSGLLTWGYAPAALAVLALAALGHKPGAMLVVVAGLLVLVSLLGAGFLVRHPRADG
jgi:hypothetical protein